MLAHPDNAYRLLREQGQLVLVFPEGSKGPGKHYSQRYRLRRFGRGGFVEIAPMKSSGTNPTAAAVALLQMFGGLDDDTRDGVAAFLKSVRCSDGERQMCPTSIDPASGAMRIRLATPPGVPRARSVMAKNSGSGRPTARSSQTR